MEVTEVKLNKNRVWDAMNPHMKRVKMLKWYYYNRKVINLLISKPTGIDDDEADVWLSQQTRQERP